MTFPDDAGVCCPGSLPLLDASISLNGEVSHVSWRMPRDISIGVRRSRGCGARPRKLERKQRRNQQTKFGSLGQPQLHPPDSSLTLEQNSQLALRFSFHSSSIVAVLVGCRFHPTRFHSYSHKNASNLTALQLELDHYRPMRNTIVPEIP